MLKFQHSSEDHHKTIDTKDEAKIKCLIGWRLSLSFCDGRQSRLRLQSNTPATKARPAAIPIAFQGSWCT